MLKDQGLMVRPTTAAQDILKKRLERGDKIIDGLVVKKGREGV